VENSDNFLILVLIGLNALQFVWNAYERQKMVNKIMSRSYYDYRLAETVKPMAIQPVEDIPLEDVLADAGSMDDMIPRM
jgi:hypothetical protein